MKGSIIKRGRRWAVILDVRDEHGARRRKWHSGFKTRKEAEAACAKLITDIAEGCYSAPSKIGVAVYVRDCALLARCLTQAQRHNLISKNPATLERPGRTTQRQEVQIVGEDRIAGLLEKLADREPMRTKVILVAMA
jgi:hypothetical protein